MHDLFNQSTLTLEIRLSVNRRARRMYCSLKNIGFAHLMGTLSTISTLRESQKNPFPLGPVELSLLRELHSNVSFYYLK